LEAILYVGLAFLVIGQLALLWAAFSTSIWWGLWCLFFSPIGAVMFLFSYWEKGKKPFLIMLIGIIVIFAGAFAMKLQAS
jgi:uncharacterized membrane protein